MIAARLAQDTTIVWEACACADQGPLGDRIPMEGSEPFTYVCSECGEYLHFAEPVSEEAASPAAGDAVTLIGTVSYVIWTSVETGFSVLKVRPLAGGSEEKVVGNMPSVEEGDRVRVTGRWEVDKRDKRKNAHLQIHADMVVLLDDDLTDEGVAQSIVKLHVMTVGPGTARKIVAALGGAHEAIQKLPTFEQQPGFDWIEQETAEAIETAWNHRRASHECDAFLASLGITPGLRQRIFKAYGARSLDVVKNDPYRLSYDVVGIGFKTADELALTKLHVHPDDPKRLRAAVYYALQEDAERDGHIYSNPRLLTAFARSVHVPADEEATLEQLKALHEEDRIVLGPSGGAALDSLYHAEEDIVSTVRRLLSESSDTDRVAMLRPEPVYHVDDIELSEEQRRAVDLILSHRISILTGAPGVGKSTVLLCLCASYGHAKVVLCAPTGRAAKRMVETARRPSSTIHRTLGFGFDPSMPAPPIDADVLIVDETSMVDSELMAMLLRALPPRCRLVMVGDPNQLPPVGPGAPFRDLIASGVVPVARLLEIRRQAEGSMIVQSAHAIMRGEGLRFSPKGDRASGGLHLFTETSDLDAASTIVRGVVDGIPKSFGVTHADIQVIVPTRKGICGVATLNAALQEELNPVQPYATFGETECGDKRFRRNDRVMQLKNDRERNIVNGDLGYVTDAHKEGLTVRMEDGRQVEYNRIHLRDLDLAYATTVHKLQGSQAKVIVVGMMKSHFPLLTRTVFYTAITRAQELCVMVGDPYAIRRAVDNVQSNQRRTLVPSMLKNLSTEDT